ncbi:MAG: protease complex subunit PrcB family protein [Proteobacteria bacterium]|nr:protease complex subunit PrcB family protein [Pseudomonadota bacterium]
MTPIGALRFVPFLALWTTSLGAAPPGGRIPLTEYLATSFPSSTVPMLRAVRSRDDWVQIWALAGSTPAPSLADVDLTKSTLLVAALGERPNGGYSVVFDGAWDLGNTIEVHVVELRSGRGCTATTTITHPAAMALIQRSDRPVRFHFATAVLNCSDAQISPGSAR